MKKKTYLQESLRNDKLSRWPNHCMPIKFYIAPMRFYSKQGQDYIYKDLVRKALAVWEQASAGRVRFQLVQSLNESQINLDWKRVDRKALGHCYFHYNAQGILYSAEVHIGLSDGILHQEYMDQNEVYHTIIHEIGHALGLGHSPNIKDIMYTPHQYGVVNLSENDKLSIQWLYRLPLAATLGEIASAYKISPAKIDDMISKIMSNNPKSQFEKVKSEIEQEKKDLLEEQTNIAELKKHNIALQNITISSDIRSALINKNFTK